MPQGDGTGPAGFGQRAGRKRGFCTGTGAPDFGENAGYRGWGRGMRMEPIRMHRGWCGSLPAAWISESELVALKEQSENLRRRLHEVESRIRQLDSSSQ